MTQPNLLELAKQGDETAIIAVMNYFLKEKGVTAQADQKDDCLLVVLKSDQLPDQQSSVAFIHKLMMKLGVESIKSVGLLVQFIFTKLSTSSGTASSLN